MFFLGGTSGAGKTTVARALSKELGAGWLQIDSLWLAMRTILAPGSREHELLNIDARVRTTDTSIDALLQQNIAAAELVCRAVPAVLALEMHAHDTLVADGAWLIPAAIERFSLPETASTSVFIHETDSHEVKRAMRSRSELPQTMPWQTRGAELAWKYGNWLADEARQRSLPVVAARPRQTLLARVRLALGV